MSNIVLTPDDLPKWSGTVLTNYDQAQQRLTTSFSGADMVVQFLFEEGRPITIGTASTLTYSIYREKNPVRTLGRITPKGITKGPATIAGTIIFTVINQHVVNDIRNELTRYQPNGVWTKMKRLRMDELPPFDIVITFGNEYGQSAKMVIYGITILDEAMTFSIEDLFTENVMTYMARDIDLMRGPWSPDMNMYTNIGEVPDTNREWLPKYQYDVNKLWANVYKRMQDEANKRLQELLDQYGNKVPAPTPVKTDFPQPPSPSSSVKSIDIRVLVTEPDGSVMPNVQVQMNHNGKTFIQSTDETGNTTFTSIMLDKPGGTTSIQFSAFKDGYIQFDHHTPEIYGPSDTVVNIHMTQPFVPVQPSPPPNPALEPTYERIRQFINESVNHAIEWVKSKNQGWFVPAPLKEVPVDAFPNMEGDFVTWALQNQGQAEIDQGEALVAAGKWMIEWVKQHSTAVGLTAAVVGVIVIALFLPVDAIIAAGMSFATFIGTLLGPIAARVMTFLQQTGLLNELGITGA